MSDAQGATGAQIETRLARIERRIEMIHADLAALAGVAARLKLMAESARATEGARGEALDAIAARLDRLEGLWRGAPPSTGSGED